MIEPQNTMMPLAADPAPVEIPQGDAGFGEMLAQTLGMIPQIDPNAIQKIAGQDSDGESDTPDLAGETGGDAADPQMPARLTRHVTIPGGAHLTAAKATPVEQAPINDGSFVNPVYDKSQPPMQAELPATPVVAPEQDTLPQPPTAAQMPAQAPVDDGIGEPVLSADEPQVAGDSLPTTPRPVAEPVATPPAATPPRATPPVATPPPASPPVEADPAVALDPVVAQPDPRPEPPPTAPISPPAESDPVVAPVRSAPAMPVATEPIQPVAAEPAPTMPERGLPTEPLPTSARTAEIPTAQRTPANATVAAVPPGTGHEVGDAVRITNAGVQMPTDSTVPVGDRAVRVEGPRPTAAGATPQPLAVEAAPQPTVATTPVTTPAAPVQHSALAERVMQAVELQANQPPPRTMVVDIPEIEGLRLVVSVRSGAEVHVVPATASTATDGVQSFLDEVQGVLESRGFVMTGDGRRRNGQPQEQDEPAPARPARPTFRRPEPTDNDLRI